MCGRYSIKNADGVVLWRAGFTDHVQLRLWAKQPPRYNVAPSQQIPVVANEDMDLQMFRWGLVPWWAKDVKIGYKMINARSETLAEKPAFKKLLTSRRCLIPADGFYEWKVEADGKTKTPMYMRMKSGEIFAFAGLWDTWKDETGNMLRSCTIITGTPNVLVAPIHDRMPIILSREKYKMWLTPGEISVDEAMGCISSYPADEMEAYLVSRLVNSPKNDGPELVQKI